MSESPLILIRSLRKRHSPEFELSIESLQVDSGEVLCLLGPTGSGKSTLLRLLTGLERPDSGDVLFDNQNAFEAAPALTRRIITVSQRPHLLSNSVRTNVEYGLKVRGHRDRTARVDKALEQCRLTALAGRDCRTLSGGQMQLVALARALVVEPDLLLLDEPTANLDPSHVELVEQIIRESCTARQLTVILATHNLFQARRLADRVALILDGSLVETADTADFFDRPTDPVTSAFIAGRMIY
jgi:tungstate transport system ATP-binding protein